MERIIRVIYLFPLLIYSTTLYSQSIADCPCIDQVKSELERSKKSNPGAMDCGHYCINMDLYKYVYNCKLNRGESVNNTVSSINELNKYITSLNCGCNYTPSSNSHNHSFNTSGSTSNFHQGSVLSQLDQKYSTEPSNVLNKIVNDAQRFKDMSYKDSERVLQKEFLTDVGAVILNESGLSPEVSYLLGGSFVNSFFKDEGNEDNTVNETQLRQEWFSSLNDDGIPRQSAGPVYYYIVGNSRGTNAIFTNVFNLNPDENGNLPFKIDILNSYKSKVGLPLLGKWLKGPFFNMQEAFTHRQNLMQSARGSEINASESTFLPIQNIFNPSSSNINGNSSNANVDFWGNPIPEEEETENEKNYDICSRPVDFDIHPDLKINVWNKPINEQAFINYIRTNGKVLYDDNGLKFYYLIRRAVTQDGLKRKICQVDPDSNRDAGNHNRELRWYHLYTLLENTSGHEIQFNGFPSFSIKMLGEDTFNDCSSFLCAEAENPYVQSKHSDNFGSNAETKIFSSPYKMGANSRVYDFEGAWHYSLPTLGDWHLAGYDINTND